jgi:hypothetical protein
MVSSERQTPAGAESRRTIVIVVAILAAAIIGVLFYFLLRATGTAPAPTALQGAIRPGTPEWNQYLSRIVLDEPEAFESRRPLGDIVMELRTTVRNFTGRTINGLEIRGAVVDHQGKPVKEKTVVIIPTRQAELGPNKTMLAQVMLEGMSEKDDRANIRLEITGFRFKQ